MHLLISLIQLGNISYIFDGIYMISETLWPYSALTALGMHLVSFVCVFYSENSTAGDKLCIVHSLTYPKSRKAPYDSTIIPIMGHLISTIKMPPRKKAVPFNLCGWKKNLYVFSIPMMNTIPTMKRICERWHSEL